MRQNLQAKKNLLMAQNALIKAKIGSDEVDAPSNSISS